MQSRIPTYIFSLFIPLALVIGCFGFYNRVEPRILGFPFIYAWIFACFFLVSASMCIGWLLDPQSDRNKKRECVAGDTSVGHCTAYVSSRAS